MFHIGQKVVCVRADAGNVHPELNPLCKGSVYTVRGFKDDDGVFLEEIQLPDYPQDWPWKGEVAFYIDRFAPVRTTDISIFTAMLAPVPRIKENT